MHDAIHFLLAGLPILFALICLVWLKMPALYTAVCSYGLAFALAFFSFDASVQDLLHSSIHGMLLSVTVIYVLVFGLLLYNLLNESGAMNIIAYGLFRFCHSPAEQGLLISAALGPFLEAVSGFGIAVVIAAPLYLSLGFSAKKTMMLSLLTQSAVPWGALAIGTVINAELSRVPLHQLGEYSAMASIPLYIFYTFIVVAVSGGKKSVKQHLDSIFLVSSVLSLVTWATSAYVSTELAGVLAGGAAGCVLIAYWKLKSFISNREIETFASHVQMLKGNFYKAVVPYAVLTVYIFVSHFSAACKRIVTDALVIQLPEYRFHLELLYSPGFALFIASLIAVWLYQINVARLAVCIKKTLRQVYPAGMATMGFIAMSSVMEGSGMTHFLAAHIAALVGSWFIIASPLIGAIGGFMSGSNSAANAMFSHFQSTMAEQLHHPALLYATAQNVSASNMTMASPSRIALAASITNRSGQEGQFVRDILPIAFAALLIIMSSIVGLGFFFE
ncbi:L-lactate permease [Saccharococcus thermophilus]|uniref:L-lactate permease n=1 Tax=Saccharococcus thermophilus TaxID=29396 RepID=A0A846MKM3_9BACL|nr:L-lactate permease [Saccharococcus thermophilus]NIK16196.1 lactate permease [Saccharococcus thermophilus]